MKNKIIILGLVFIILLIVLIPGRFVQNLIPDNIPIKLESMKGTAWSGQIKSATIQGLTANDIDYQINFFSLLVASLSGSLVIGSGDVTGAFDFSASGVDEFSLEQASLKMTAGNLEKFIPFPGIQLQGAISTEALTAQLVEGKLTFLSGGTGWSNASVTINNQRQALGDFTVDWTTNESDNLITGRFRKTKNEMGLEGNITINSAGVAEFKGSISSSADRNLYTALSLFADGKVELGRLPVKFKKKIQ